MGLFEALFGCSENKKKCEACNGMGRIEETTYLGSDYPYGISSYKCVTCKGKGYI